MNKKIIIASSRGRSAHHYLLSFFNELKKQEKKRKLLDWEQFALRALQGKLTKEEKECLYQRINAKCKSNFRNIGESRTHNLISETCSSN